MPDGTSGVVKYFQARYPNGTVDYTTQVAQKASWYTPTTPAAVHDSIHYNQIGYNEIGRESVRNALIMLDEIEAPDVEITAELLSWDSYSTVDSIGAATVGLSDTLVVPKIYPLWKAKEVTYTLSDGLTWSYYDLLADSDELNGTLTVMGTELSVTVVGHNWSDWETISEPSAEGTGKQQKICTDCGKLETRPLDEACQIYALGHHLIDLPNHFCCDTNLWTILPHEEVYFTRCKKWDYSSVPVCSISVPLTSGDKIYATPFPGVGQNGGLHSGICLTFFNSEGITWNLDYGIAYRERKQGGYITAPEGTIAVNIPMWNDSENYEIYIANRDHTYENGVCMGCGPDQPVPVIITQPEDAVAAMGENNSITVKAQGESLKYQWYFRNAGSNRWHKSSVKDNIYAGVMTIASASREVYCVITDANGNSVTTNIAKLIRMPSVKQETVTWPINGEAVLGEVYCAAVGAWGQRMKYQRYFCNTDSTMPSTGYLSGAILMTIQ